MTDLAKVVLHNVSPRPRVVEITIAQLRESGGDLLQQHYTEVTQDKRYPLDPHWPGYERMEAAGLVLLLGAFVGDELVGYSLNFVYPRHLHYDYGFAQNDVFFVTKSHRGKQWGTDETIGDLLIAETERITNARGGRKVFCHVKKGTAMDRWLAGKDGYRVADIVYVKDV